MTLKSPTMRISIALTLLTVNLLFLANLIGLIPDKSEMAIEMRKGLSESLALQFSAVASNGDFQIIQNTLREVVKRNKEIRSAAIRTHDGHLIALAGEHLAHWKIPDDGKSTPVYIHVPVYRNGKNWANVELRFAPLWTENLASGFSNSFAALIAFITLSGFLCYFFVMRRTLRELDPSAVIPDRVQRAFDVLKEGVLILDENEQIVMANQSISAMFETESEKLIGRKGSELGWLEYNNPKQRRKLPWLIAMRENEEQKSIALSIKDRLGKEIKLAVNAAIVTDNAGNSRGCMVTFDDLSQLEEKNSELHNLVELLQTTNYENLEKSQELEFLANHDPLTMCLNRRALDRKLGKMFSRAKDGDKNLSCLMVDIDHFKSVNDRFGHAVGDQVIKTVAGILKSSTRDEDLVSRYGGEEFCVVLSDLDQENATQIAERIRRTIDNEPCAGVKTAVSLGVSSLEHNANKPDELVNQADKALYAAKKSGRNRVVQWGQNDPQSDNLITEIETSYIPSSFASPEEETLYLQRRVEGLEELLEKRTIESAHHEMYDVKTGLPTRALFTDRVRREIVRAKRQDYLVVVVSIAIDMINRIYETMGLTTAELLLKTCGNRLNDVLRAHIDTVAVVEEGVSTVSLINQAEMAILLTEIKQVDNVTWVVKRLIDSFDEPFQVNEHEIYLSAYVGVSLFPHDGQTVEELYSGSLNACSYAQKNKSKQRYHFSSDELNRSAIKQLKVESALHSAIGNDELELHFQPKIKSSTGLIHGFEALLRWKSRQLGNIPPDEFIKIAELSGQIDSIGDWVICRACEQQRKWQDLGLNVGPIAINLSGAQLQQHDLSLRIQTILNEYDLTPQDIEIELTESSLVNSHDKSFLVLKQIKELGTKVTMDDFGTGYSSLSYLKDIPLSCLKIDRSFTFEIGKSDRTEKLIESIISMAHGLGLEVVAEGVEDEDQAEYLKKLGCEYFQGYYYGKPLPEKEAIDLYKKNLVGR